MLRRCVYMSISVSTARYTIGSTIRCLLFFFFQAEDGIRDLTVTGVQTCALPISPASSRCPGSCRRSCVRAEPDVSAAYPLWVVTSGGRDGAFGPCTAAARQARLDRKSVG